MDGFFRREKKKTHYLRDSKHSPTMLDVGMMFILKKTDEPSSLLSKLSSLTVNTNFEISSASSDSLLSWVNSSMSASMSPLKQSNTNREAITMTSSCLSSSTNSSPMNFSSACSSESTHVEDFKAYERRFNSRRYCIIDTSCLVNPQQFLDENITLDANTYLSKLPEKTELLSGLFAFLLYEGEDGNQYLVFKSTQFCPSGPDDAHQHEENADIGGVQKAQHGRRESFHGGIKLVKTLIVSLTKRNFGIALTVPENPLFGGEIQFDDGSIAWWNAKSGGFSPGTPFDNGAYVRALEQSDDQQALQELQKLFTKVKKVFLPTHLFTVDSYDSEENINYVFQNHDDERTEYLENKFKKS